MAHIRVYAIANKYEILELKALAKWRFDRLIHKQWPIPNFDEVIIEVYESPTESKDGLRNIVNKKFTQKITTIIDNQKIQGLALEHGEFSLGTVIEVANTLSHEKKTREAPLSKGIAARDTTILSWKKHLITTRTLRNAKLAESEKACVDLTTTLYARSDAACRVREAADGCKSEEESSCAGP